MVGLTHDEFAYLHRGFTAEWHPGKGPYLWVSCTCGANLGECLRPAIAAEYFEVHAEVELELFLLERKKGNA